MITLITGGSKCGKSSLAERLLDGFPDGGKYYIATMIPFGDEAEAAVARHRIMRSGKGFETVEKYTDIHELSFENGCGILLECIGNLCANEMFSNEEIKNPVTKIVNGIKSISQNSEHLVIVTNEVGCDGYEYTAETQFYIRAMAEINREIALMADNVIECVYGIPIILKGEIRC